MEHKNICKQQNILMANAGYLAWEKRLLNTFMQSTPEKCISINSPSVFLVSTAMPFTNFYQEIQPNEIDRKFIRLEKSLYIQWQELKGVYARSTYNSLKAGMLKSLPFLLDLNPDKISLQLSYDKSIFYTLIKNNYTIYFDHYVELEEGMDEVIVSVFKEKMKLLNVCSSFENVVEIIKQINLGETVPSFIIEDEIS